MDIMTRITGKYVEKYLNTPVETVNKPAAAGVAAFNYLINARPDGYTVGVFGVSMFVNDVLGRSTYLMDNVHVVARVADAGNVLGVKPNSPWKTYQDFVQYAKKNPGVKMGALGPGSVAHMRMQNINHETNLGLTFVPYKGDAEVIPALLGDHIPIGLFSTSGIMPLVAAGKVRLLFSFEKPAEIGIDPSIDDFASIYGKTLTDINNSGSLVVRANTPPHIIQTLERTIEKISKDPSYVSELKKNYISVNFSDGKKFREQIYPKEIARIKAVAQSSELIK